ncbi:MAG: hypothetical protein ACTS9Y_04665 [Methylophilus sp.]|uniref:hypothetical protein n=1 Tax=Methylophilus sp. TaxID=29541 RepID=UPI003F9EFD68
MNDTSKPEEKSYFSQILESPGVKFLNQLHARSFSLNTFQMNASELIEATLKVNDPEHGLSLMSQDHRDAGRQAHRELSRHIHNFVASAKALVDHTRVFMREHYAGTETYKKYDAQVTNTFSKNAVSKFVHDLRNYILHRGMPNSHMFLSMKQDPSLPELGATITSGIRFDTKSLLEWSGWTAPSKGYIAQNGEFINISPFVEEYLVRVNSFNDWLDTLLREHHASDLAELTRLQELDALTTSTANNNSNLQALPSDNSIQEEALSAEPFTFLAQEAIVINEMCNVLLSKISEILLPPNVSNNFPTQRPVATTITDKDIIGSPKYTGADINGEDICAFIFNNKKLFGLKISELEELEDICDTVHQTPWTKNKLSRGFIRNEFFEWAQKNYLSDKKNSFTEAIIAKSRAKVTHYELWAPISHLEVESSFEFGSVTISPITSDRIDDIEKISATIQSQKIEVEKFFLKMRGDLQDLAAVVISSEVEPELAYEKGLITAQDVVSLLRFFSPGASASWVLCPIDLYGQEIIPKSKLFLTTKSSFSMRESILSKGIGEWRLSTTGLEHLEEMGLGYAGKLVNPIGLNDFATSVRTSIIQYSKGTTFPTIMDRLSHALLAIEEILLKHELEHVEPRIANRLSLMLSGDQSERAEIANNVRQIYWLIDQPKANQLTSREQELVAQFTFNAHQGLQVALKNIEIFQFKAEFIDAVERSK